MRILTVNAGSSSVKLSLLDDGDRLLATYDHLDAALADRPDAIGHRVVHGGDRRSPAPLDDATVVALRALTDLAPLHQPPALALIARCRAALPDVPEVACFDTAFHATLPPAAATYALPREWRERWPLRRYGFHGLSHAWSARRAAELGCGPRVVIAHLGSGASLCATRDGVSVDTTMGFSPLDGLVMATRPGSVDPGLLLWLQTHGGLSADEVSDGLERRSGLMGLAGTTDLRTLLADADQVPIDVYLHRLRAGIAAMTAALGGLDALVFTGGVGENHPAIRRRAVEALTFLGLAVDHARNEGVVDDSDVGDPKADVRVLVIRAREDVEIARGVRAVLTG